MTLPHSPWRAFLPLHRDDVVFNSRPSAWIFCCASIPTWQHFARRRKSSGSLRLIRGIGSAVGAMHAAIAVRQNKLRLHRNSKRKTHRHSLLQHVRRYFSEWLDSSAIGKHHLRVSAWRFDAAPSDGAGESRCRSKIKSFERLALRGGSYRSDPANAGEGTRKAA